MPLITVRVEHVFLPSEDTQTVLSAINNLKEIIMSGFDDIKRELQEQTAQNAVIQTALTGLMSVIQPLMAAAAAASAALAAAQVELAALQSSNAALDAELAAAAANVDAGQQAVQPLLDAANAIINPPPAP